MIFKGTFLKENFPLQPVSYFFLIFLISLLYTTSLFAQEKQNISLSGQQPVIEGSSFPASNKKPAAVTDAMPPEENRYDVLSKILLPLTAVFFGNNSSSLRAMTLHMTMEQALGNLPAALKGASLKAALQYPNKIRVEIPFGDSRVTICRHGNKVWVFPGSKIAPLLSNAQSLLKSDAEPTMPLQLPITPEQALLLPALFQLDDRLELATVKGIPCRALRGRLMTEFAEAAELEDLSTTIWVASGYIPKRVDIKRRQFAISLSIDEIGYSTALPASTWQEPKNETDIYRCDSTQLQALLSIVLQPH